MLNRGSTCLTVASASSAEAAIAAFRTPDSMAARMEGCVFTAGRQARRRCPIWLTPGNLMRNIAPQMTEDKTGEAMRFYAVQHSH